jgi:hypothetical protein
MKKIQHELIWGIYFTMMMISWMDIEKIGGFHDTRIELHPFFTNLVMIPAIAIYVMAIRKKRLQLGGRISYKQAFISGAIMTFFVTLFTPLVIYVSVTWISPDFFKNMIRFATENKLMTNTAAIEYFNLKSYMIQSVIATPFMGFITTAIVAIFSSRKK